MKSAEFVLEHWTKKLVIKLAEMSEPEVFDNLLMFKYITSKYFDKNDIVVIFDNTHLVRMDRRYEWAKVRGYELGEYPTNNDVSHIEDYLPNPV